MADYLIHFNRNHSKANGRFVKGDGDGDGKPNDHTNPTVNNKKLYTEYGKKIGNKNSSNKVSTSKSLVNDYNKTENTEDIDKKKVTDTSSESNANNIHINADGSAVQITKDGQVHIFNTGGVKNLKDYAIKQYEKEHPKIENDVRTDKNPTMTSSTPVSKVKSSSSGKSYTETKKTETVPDEKVAANYKAKCQEYINRYSKSSSSTTTKKKEEPVYYIRV